MSKIDKKILYLNLKKDIDGLTGEENLKLLEYKNHQIENIVKIQDGFTSLLERLMEELDVLDDRITNLEGGI